MLVRFAQERDFEDLVAIGHKFFEFNAYRQHSKLDEDSLRATFKDLADNHILLVVDLLGKVVGTAGAYIAPVYWNRNELQGLEAFWWIEPQYRQGGIGKELRLFLQHKARERGVRFWNMIALKESMHDEVCQQYQKAGMTHVETVYMKVL